MNMNLNKKVALKHLTLLIQQLRKSLYLINDQITKGDMILFTYTHVADEGVLIYQIYQR